MRNGRRVQELAAELRVGERDDRPGERAAHPGGAGGSARPRCSPGPAGTRAGARRCRGPEQGKVVKFALSDPDATSLATTGMEMSWLTDPWSLGPGQGVDAAAPADRAGRERRRPLVRLVATADFGNGISAELPFDEYLFINADLTIHLWRAPRGEWIGLDAKTVLMDGGVGTAESVLHDEPRPGGTGGADAGRAATQTPAGRPLVVHASSCYNVAHDNYLRPGAVRLGPRKGAKMSAETAVATQTETRSSPRAHGRSIRSIRASSSRSNTWGSRP